MNRRDFLQASVAVVATGSLVAAAEVVNKPDSVMLNLIRRIDFPSEGDLIRFSVLDNKSLDTLYSFPAEAAHMYCDPDGHISIPPHGLKIDNLIIDEALIQPFTNHLTTAVNPYFRITSIKTGDGWDISAVKPGWMTYDYSNLEAFWVVMRGLCLVSSSIRPSYDFKRDPLPRRDEYFRLINKAKEIYREQKAALPEQHLRDCWTHPC